MSGHQEECIYKPSLFAVFFPLYLHICLANIQKNFRVSDDDGSLPSFLKETNHNTMVRC